MNGIKKIVSATARPDTTRHQELIIGAVGPGIVMATYPIYAIEAWRGHHVTVQSIVSGYWCRVLAEQDAACCFAREETGFRWRPGAGASH